MNQNIVFTFKDKSVPDTDDEDCVQIVNDIIATKLKETPYVMGSLTTGDGKTHVMG